MPRSEVPLFAAWQVSNLDTEVTVFKYELDLFFAREPQISYKKK